MKRLLRSDRSGRTYAYVHGGHHDLWWEFRLVDSLKWQAHLHRMAPDTYRRRVAQLTAALGLSRCLGDRVEDLTAGVRVRADLAVALLPQPELLVWDEPFLQTPAPERNRLWHTVTGVCERSACTVLAVAGQPPGLPVGTHGPVAAEMA